MSEEGILPCRAKRSSPCTRAWSEQTAFDMVDNLPETIQFGHEVQTPHLKEMHHDGRRPPRGALECLVDFAGYT